ncbi:MAG: RNA polymerase sigma factor [Candidatus Komeilibacteria bacterium]|jgi:RNA polymerase sigma-70 factor, ECF subfamily|nr:RNA polymerase sigma factor [Candidatus Komeilibacteria bacterium]MBT4447398.1 RNA polymerase sigma factor [Candidatus Komeilibacteria bacterium]
MSDIVNKENLSDEQLVELTLENQEDFLYLINRYEAKLARYIKRIAGLGKEDTEDLLQEVFIKIYQNINNFDKDLKFSSWAYRITHNEVIDNYRKKQSRPQEMTFDAENILNNIISEFNISKELDHKYLQANISQVLNSLDLKYREVLVLKFLEEKEYKEISDILKKPMGTVATLISRAKKQFLQKMKEQEIKL